MAKRANIFTTVQTRKPRSNMFDLSHDRKYSMQMGRLVPCMVQEVVPGDNFNIKSEQLVRVAPLLAPVMHDVNCYMHYFFVPNRLTWSNWEDFIVGGVPPADPPAAPLIRIGAGGVSILDGSLGDYLGLPTILNTDTKNFTINALPLAAYLLIFNEYYRDENLVDEIPYELVDGIQPSADTSQYLEFPPLKRAWQHDYFTSCLPFAQKGDAVDIPLYGEADVYFDPSGGNTWTHSATTGARTNYPSGLNSDSGPGLLQGLGGDDPVNIDNSDLLKVDLTTATGATINDLRRAIALQQWLELNARGGSRYIEHILAHFGVMSDDARLQRPEYIGGGKSKISFSEVLQMSESADTPQGNMAGHGISFGETYNAHYYAKEHGFIIGIMSVMPATGYFQGLPRFYTRPTYLDYFWDKFANIGEQEVLNRELYIHHTQPDGVFGYIPRFSEYKYGINTVHGDFKNSLKYWHMAREFESDPNLNADFIECDPTSRIFAVTDPNEHKLYIYQYHRVMARRLMPVYGTPGLSSI